MVQELQMLTVVVTKRKMSEQNLMRRRRFILLEGLDLCQVVDSRDDVLEGLSLSISSTSDDKTGRCGERPEAVR